MSAPRALTAGYNGTVPFICAPTQIVSCTPDAGREKTSVESVYFPRFLTFGIGADKITGTRPEPL